MQRRLLLLAPILFAACSSTVWQTPPPLPAALIVLPQAKELRHTNEYEGTVSYTVDEEYPADKAIATIPHQLEAAGWQGLREDWLNPGVATSLARGWSEYDDAVPGHRQGHVFQ